MIIGEKIVFLESFEFNKKKYKRGHQFTITKIDTYQIDNTYGINLEDSEGNKILNIRPLFDDHFLIGRPIENTWFPMCYKLLNEIRNDKLKELGI